MVPHPMKSGLSAPVFDEAQSRKKPHVHHQRVRSLYDVSSSDEEDGDNENTKTVNAVAAVRAPKEDGQWVVDARNKRWEYDTKWFQIPKMRNGKATGQQLRPFMEQSGLSKDELKRIWRLSDLDKDGKMGSEEFALCMLLMEEARNGKGVPDKLPMNYVPPSVG